MNISNNNEGRRISQNIGQFVLGKTLGEGTFGKVKMGIHTITKEKVILSINM
jgi:5'-AMP-activated protein kinase catalytic alpha subunit